MVKNGLNIVMGVMLMLPCLARSSGINGDPKELFGTGKEPESINMSNCRKDVSDNNRYVGWNKCWKNCEALLPEGSKWPDIVGRYGRGQGDIDSLWKPAVESFIKFRIGQKDQDIKSSQTGQEFGELLGFLHQCHALITITGHSNYSSDEFSRMGHGHHTRKSLVNPQLKCMASGYDTQDYPKCLRLIKFYDTFTFAKAAKQTVDTIRYDDHVADENDKLTKKRLEGDTVGAEDGLNVQKESLKKQKSIATENMTISAAQAASLVAIIKSMPTWKSLLEDECLPRMQNKESEFQKLYDHGKTMAQVKDTLEWKEPASLLEADPLCANITEMNINLILNTDARNTGIMLGIQSGIDAVANLAKGQILKNRIKGIDGAIKKIEGFEPEPLTEEEMEDMYFQECVVRPDLPKCKIRNRRSVDGVNNTYSFGTETRSTVIDDSKNIDEEDSSGTNPGVDRKNLPSKVGISLPDANSLGNSDFSGAIPPGASYTGKGVGNPGGGGGSGGVGSAPPPGNDSGGDGRRSGASAPLPPAKVTYDGQGGGWKGYNSGGKGGGRQKSQGQAQNPFAKLFGKNGKKGTASELIDFRNPASKGRANRNIFQRISKRYGEAHKKKKLLEYTTEKED